jgi:hypothetical protein
LENLEHLGRPESRPRGGPLAVAVALSLSIWLAVAAFIALVLLG